MTVMEPKSIARSSLRRLARRAAAAALMLASCAVANGVSAQTGASWTAPGGTPQGTQYSSLNDITTANVGSLVEEFSYPTGTKAAHQGSPLVVGNVMYYVTPFPDNLIALDLAHPGKALWTFKPNPGAYARGLTCCDLTNRGAAYANGLVVYTLLDGNVVAVNATTGAQVWRTKVADPWAGETLNTPVIIVNNKVIFGSSGSEQGIRGSVRALDLTTGKLAWQAYSTGPDAEVLIGPNFHPYYAKDQGANLGVTTWSGTQWKQGGGSVWGWITYDPETNQIFYGTSQPGTFNADQRPGDNKWGISIFARNPDTGKANWAYQLIAHDNWDFDAANENTVLDATFNGTPAKVIVHFNKNGFAYIIDRTTGRLLSANTYAPENWASKIDLTTGAPLINTDKLTHQGTITTNICPSAFGAKDWEYSSFSKKTKLFYFGGHTLCMDYEGLQANFIAGTPFTGVSIGMYPSTATGTMGEFVAFDPAKGQRAWSVPEAAPVFGGALSTAGNVVFYGTMDKNFKALDAKTGKLLFSKQLECGIVSAPITFTGPDGKQRVAIVTGTGYLTGPFAGGACPAGSPFGGGAASALGRAVADFAASKPAAPASAATSGYIHVFKLP